MSAEGALQGPPVSVPPCHLPTCHPPVPLAPVAEDAGTGPGASRTPGSSPRVNQIPSLQQPCWAPVRARRSLQEPPAASAGGSRGWARLRAARRPRFLREKRSPGSCRSPFPHRNRGCRSVPANFPLLPVTPLTASPAPAPVELSASLWRRGWKGRGGMGNRGYLRLARCAGVLRCRPVEPTWGGKEREEASGAAAAIAPTWSNFPGEVGSGGGRVGGAGAPARSAGTGPTDGQGVGYP